MYRELSDIVGQTGAILVFLPSYCPQFNPIELGFGSLKRWIQKECRLAPGIFGQYPDLVLDVAMPLCTRPSSTQVLGSFRHCGYADHGIDPSVFTLDP